LNLIFSLSNINIIIYGGLEVAELNEEVMSMVLIKNPAHAGLSYK